MAVSLQYRNKLLALYTCANTFLINVINTNNINIDIAQHPSNIMFCVIIFISFIIFFVYIKSHSINASIGDIPCLIHSVTSVSR